MKKLNHQARVTVSSISCPKCGSQEIHPTNKNLALINAFKVHIDGHWWSHCLVCAGYYNEDLTPKPAGLDGLNPDGVNNNKGWF